METELKPKMTPLLRAARLDLDNATDFYLQALLRELAPTEREYRAKLQLDATEAWVREIVREEIGKVFG